MFTYCFNNEFISIFFISLLCVLYFYDDERCKMNFPVRDNNVLLYCIALYCIVYYCQFYAYGTDIRLACFLQLNVCVSYCCMVLNVTPGVRCDGNL